MCDLIHEFKFFQFTLFPENPTSLYGIIWTSILWLNLDYH